ncbi:MAG: hypothetical protein ACP5RV_12885 [Thiomonas sp.]
MNAYLERLKAISAIPLVRELPKLPKGGRESEKAPVRELSKLSKGAFGTFGSARTTHIRKIAPANDAHNIDRRLGDLLALHGTYPRRADRLDCADGGDS